MPNLADRRQQQQLQLEVDDKPPIWGQFHFVASRTSTFTTHSHSGGRGIDASSVKTISFVDLDEDDQKPIDKYGDDDDQV